MTDEEIQRKQQERFQQFLKCLDGLQKSVARLTEAVGRQTEITALFFDAVTKKDDGLIAALDDTIEVNEALRVEIQGLRQDLPKFARAISAPPIYRRPGT